MWHQLLTQLSFPPRTADYSCTYTGLAETDSLTCYITSTYPISTTGSTTFKTISTEYADPSLYFDTVTVTAGLESLSAPAVAGATESPAEPTIVSDESDAEEATGDVGALVPTTALTSPNPTEAAGSGSTDEAGGTLPTSAGSSIARSGVVVAVLAAVGAGLAMI